MHSIYMTCMNVARWFGPYIVRSPAVRSQLPTHSLPPCMAIRPRGIHVSSVLLTYPLTRVVDLDHPRLEHGLLHVRGLAGKSLYRTSSRSSKPASPHVLSPVFISSHIQRLWLSSRRLHRESTEISLLRQCMLLTAALVSYLPL